MKLMKITLLGLNYICMVEPYASDYISTFLTFLLGNLFYFYAAFKFESYTKQSNSCIPIEISS